MASRGYTFNEILKDASGFILSPCKKTENKGYFTNARVDRDTIPDGWYAYDIRHGDGGGFVEIKEWVEVNHAGTFLTQQKIDLGEKGYKTLNGGYTFN